MGLSHRISNSASKLRTRCRFRRSENGIDRLTITFIDKDKETAFVKSKMQELAGALFKLAGVCASGAAFALLVGAKETTYGSSLRRRMWILIFVLCLIVMALVRWLCKRKCGAVALEGLGVALTLLACCFVILVDPYYLTRLARADPSEVWDGATQFRDTQTCLLMDMFVTGAHTIPPIRWRCLLPVAGGGTVIYLLAGIVLEPTVKEARFYNTFFLGMLSLFASWGKRMREHQERNMFTDLIAERVLRCQTEFQLSQLSIEDRKSRHDRSAITDQRSNSESRPSTTDTGRAFDEVVEVNDKLSLDGVLAIGSREQWLIGSDELRIMPEIVLGSGKFGTVVRGEYQGIPVAVKRPKSYSSHKHSVRTILQLCNELRILRRVRHPNVVFLYGAFVNADDGLSLVMELVDGKSLYSLIVGMDADGWPRPTDLDKMQIMVDISCALAYLHGRVAPVVHGDIKADNMMVERRYSGRGTFKAKLLDFGISRILTKHARPLGGTMRYAAPEAYATQTNPQPKPAPPADVFSVGRLAFFVSTGLEPLHHLDRQVGIRRAPYLPLQWPSACSELGRHCRRIVDRCDHIDPNLRLSMRQVYTEFMELAAKSEEACKELQEGKGRNNYGADHCSAAARSQPGRRRKYTAAEKAGDAAENGSPLAAPLPPVAEGPYEAVAHSEEAPTENKFDIVTPFDTRLCMVVEMMSLWCGTLLELQCGGIGGGGCNPTSEREGRSCCPTHIQLMSLAHVWRAIATMRCHTFPPAEMAGQCRSCGALVPEEQVDARGAFTCNTCGADSGKGPMASTGADVAGPGERPSSTRRTSGRLEL